MTQYSLQSNSFPALPGYHSGSGSFSAADNVVDPLSVNGDVSLPLRFKYLPYSIIVLSVEITTPDAPNWFAVSMRQGINAFDTVNIFCHPYPSAAGMKDEDYAARAGNWPRLFRYAEIFGRQVGMAKTNHITIVPCFTNASYNDTGIFGPNWKDMVEQILDIARAAAQNVSPTSQLYFAPRPVEHLRFGPQGQRSSNNLKNVVLSDFSHGRVLLGALRRHGSGLGQYLREIWDFDGVHAPAPLGAGVRSFIYNQSSNSSVDPTTFPVPPSRWQEYHHRILSAHDNHGALPERLAYHAATISSVGR